MFTPATVAAYSGHCEFWRLRTLASVTVINPILQWSVVIFRTYVRLNWGSFIHLRKVGQLQNPRPQRFERFSKVVSRSGESAARRHNLKRSGHRGRRILVTDRDFPLLDDVAPCQNNRRSVVAVLRMARFA